MADLLLLFLHSLKMLGTCPHFICPQTKEQKETPPLMDSAVFVHFNLHLSLW